jgi:hypothetical protein
VKKWTMQHLPEYQVLVFACHGTINAKDTHELGIEALAEAARLGVDRVLVDDREMTPEGTTMEFYRTAQTLRAIGMKPSHRVAVVFPPSRPGAEDMHFFETVCFNMGISLRLFGNMESAMVWLVEGKA